MNTMAKKMQMNIRRNYVFSFLMNLRLSSGLWMIYMAYKGMSLTQIGILEGVFHVTSLTMEVPTGSIADLFGRKTSRTLGRCLSLLSILVLISSTDFFRFLLFMILAALSYNLESGSGEALVYDSLKYLGISDKYMRVLGRQEAIFQSASIAAFLLGGLLGTFNYYLAFWTSAVIIAVTIAYSLLFTEPPIDDIEPANRRSMRGFCRQIIDSFSIIRRVKMVGFLIVFTQTILALSTCIFFYMQNYWKGEGRTEFEIGIFLAMGSFAAAIMATRVHRVSIFLKGKRLLVLLPLISVISMWFIAFFPYKIPFFIVISLIEAMLFVVSNDYINRLIPSRSRATIISFASMAYSIVMILVFPVFGRLADSFSYRIAFMALAVAGSVLYIMNMFIMSRIEQGS